MYGMISYPFLDTNVLLIGLPIWRGAHITEFLFMVLFLQSSATFSPRDPNVFLETLTTLSLIFILVWQTKFQTHTKHHVELWFCIS